MPKAEHSPPSVNRPNPVSATFSEVQEYYAGPLPPPQLLRQFEDVAPGSAQQIIQLMVDQAHHRMDLESTVINGDNRRAYLGMVTGFIIALAGLVLAGVLGMNGHDVLAGAITLADIGGLAGIFVYGSNLRKNEREQKAKNATRPRGRTP